MTQSHHCRMLAAIPLAALMSGACIFVVHEEEHHGSPARPARSTFAPTAAHAATVGVDGARWLADVTKLASDEFEGRAPATIGEERTVEFLVRSLQEAGLEPGNQDGTFVQDVPLVGYRSRVRANFTAGNQPLVLSEPDEALFVSRRLVPKSTVEEAAFVFVGYGVVAPEYGWDDYKDVDVRGKVLVMLVNDPPVVDARDPARLDDAYFGGRAMTYYGRWTYKYEIAAEKGAAGVLVVHQTATAGYPWGVLSGGYQREDFELDAADKNAGRAVIEGWLTIDGARKLVSAAGRDFAQLEAAAARPDFRPVELDARVRFEVENELRSVRSQNVVARLSGADPKLRDESVIYTAHWDHLGLDEAKSGDRIYNGAIDNATGTAGVVAIARAAVARRTQIPRSMLFLLVTAEEKGLLGSRYYATHPLHPLEKTLAVINIDAMSGIYGATADIVSIGYGQSTLDETLVAAAAGQGRVVLPDPEPQRGIYYRSDHFEFAKVGVPAMYADGGSLVVGRPVGYGAARTHAYISDDYHEPSDEVRDDWDVAGVVRDLDLLLEVGIDVARESTWPAWKEKSEFRARREAHLARTRR